MFQRKWEVVNSNTVVNEIKVNEIKWMFNFSNMGVMLSI